MIEYGKCACGNVTHVKTWPFLYSLCVHCFRKYLASFQAVAA